MKAHIGDNLSLFRAREGKSWALGGGGGGGG